MTIKEFMNGEEERQLPGVPVLVWVDGSPEGEAEVYLAWDSPDRRDLGEIGGLTVGWDMDAVEAFRRINEWERLLDDRVFEQAVGQIEAS